MLIKLLVGVFEKAKSKLTSANANDRNSTDSENESNVDEQRCAQSGSFIIEQPSRLSLTKWLCTTPANVNRSSFSLKSSRVRRSSSWRSLKERGNNYLEHFTSRTLSVDELHRNGKKSLKSESKKQQTQKQLHSKSTVILCDLTNNNNSSTKSFGSSFHPVRIANCDESPCLSSTQQRTDRYSSNVVQYGSSSKTNRTISQGINYSDQQSLLRLTRHNTNSGGGDSGYSEDSFGFNRNSSNIRPLHTSCPHCHCEKGPSFLINTINSNKQVSNDSSTSDTTINKDILTPDLSTRSQKDNQHLSTSRSFPHIKPLPKSKILSNTETSEPVRRAKTLTTRRRARRRHLSCDSSLWPKVQIAEENDLKSTRPMKNNSINHSFGINIKNIEMIDNSSLPLNQSKSFMPLPRKTQVFGELNLAAIELDSLRTQDYHRLSFSSSYSSSLTSSSSSLTLNEQQTKRTYRRSNKLCQHRRGTFLVWHEYKNTSILSTNHGNKIFSVIRGDQVRLLRRIGKSTLLVQKEDDGTIGFLPQSCLADDQIHSFLSVKGLRETVL